MAEDALRFAMVTTFYPPYHFGGDAMYVRRLAHALAGRGHHVEVIHDVDAFRILNQGAEPEPVEEPHGIQVHGLRSAVPGLSCLATQQFGRPVVHGRRIRALLDAGRFDVIHFHNISLVGGPGVLACGDAIKLYTAHEHWLVCPSHILWRHGREPCPERECLRCVLRSKRPPQLWRRMGTLPRAAKHVDRFMSPSHFSANKHREFGFESPMEVIPLFLSDPAPPAIKTALGPERSVHEGRPFFLFVGRLEEIKGLQDVIPLFGEDVEADLLIAGSGEFEGELRRLAEGKPSVRFLGQVTPEDLEPLYAATLAVLAPSRCFEVFPMILLEAFREGTPVIARRLGPYPEVIEESGAGLLFETEAELAAALARMLGDPALRDRLGASGRATFEQRWSEDVVLERYFELIAEVARERDDPSLVDRLARLAASGPRE